MGILRHPATLLVLVLIVVLLFGSKRLPDVARSVGQSLKIFKGEVKDLREDGSPSSTSSPGAPGPSATSSDVAGGSASSTVDDSPDKA